MSSDEIRGTDAKYGSFLWKELGKIRDAEAIGDYKLALELATSLITYLPVHLKKEFHKRADQISDALSYLSSKTDGTDIFTTSVAKHRRLQQVASRLLGTFVNDLTSYLDDRGYMEWKKKKVATGYEVGLKKIIEQSQ